MSKLTPSVNELDNQLAWPEYAITLVEYGDYECPYCGCAYPIVKRLLQEQGREIRFVFRNFPLSTIHPNAINAALAAEAAARQSRFWDMHDALFENQQNFSDDLYLQLADEMGLHVDTFREDFNNEGTRQKVNLDFKSGLQSGVNRTPTFFIDDEKIELGELSYEALRREVDSRLLATNRNFRLI